MRSNRQPMNTGVCRAWTRSSLALHQCANREWAGKRWRLGQWWRNVKKLDEGGIFQGWRLIRFKLMCLGCRYKINSMYVGTFTCLPSIFKFLSPPHFFCLFFSCHLLSASILAFLLHLWSLSIRSHLPSSFFFCLCVRFIICPKTNHFSFPKLLPFFNFLLLFPAFSALTIIISAPLLSPPPSASFHVLFPLPPPIRLSTGWLWPFMPAETSTFLLDALISLSYITVFCLLPLTFSLLCAIWCSLLKSFPSLDFSLHPLPLHSFIPISPPLFNNI